MDRDGNATAIWAQGESSTAVRRVGQRRRALEAIRRGPPSHSFGTITLAGGAPTSLWLTVTGSIVSLSWSPPAGGPAVSHYVAYVSGTYVGSFTATGRILSGAAAPGAYALSVAAANACGAGGAGATQTVVVP